MRSGRVGAPVVGMHDFQSLGSAPGFTEAADARATGKTGLLLQRKVEKPQREKPRPVGNPAQ
jgi:hypothetical protein